MENNVTQRKNLLNILRAIDFAIYDTVLYLDAYPDSREALCYYNNLIEDRAIVRTEYQKKFGPLTAFENQCATEWQWVNDPWPWEADAN